MLLKEIYLQNKEEYWNIVTHCIGFLCALIFMLLLLLKLDHHSLSSYLAILIIGFTSMLVYFSSSLYHYKWSSSRRQLYRTIDHISIFFLIAGSYTPFILLTFPTDIRWKMMIIIWSLAFVGTVFKLFNTGKYENLSVLFYILMGWAVLLEFQAFVSSTPTHTLSFIMAGGLLYLIGVIFYKWRSLKYNHAIWHCFVILANMAHLAAVYTII